MKIGVRDDCVAGSCLREKMKVLKSIGYDFAELVLKPDMIDSLDGQAARNYNRLANETGIPFITTSIGHFTHFASKPREERNLILEQIKKAIDLTAALGGDVILMASMESTTEIYSYLGIYKDELKETADYGWERGVSLALEPVGRFKTAILGRLIREIGHPGIGLYYDMGNCIYGGEDPVEQARTTVDIIKAIHIKGGENMELAEMPLYAIIKILRNGGFNGPGCVEIASNDGTNTHLESALGMLKGIGY